VRQPTAREKTREKKETVTGEHLVQDAAQKDRSKSPKLRKKKVTQRTGRGPARGRWGERKKATKTKENQRWEKSAKGGPLKIKGNLREGNQREELLADDRRKKKKNSNEW